MRGLSEQKRGGFDSQSRRKELLSKAGLRALTPAEEEAVSADYQQALLAGLDQRDSSVKMFRTEIKSAKIGELPEGAETLVIEIGGTNRYIARVVIENGQPVVKQKITSRLSTLKFDSPEAFFAELTQGIKQIMPHFENIDGVAIVYSFPGSATTTNRGDIDVNSPEELPKDFVITGISQKPVGEALLQFLSEYYGVDPTVPLAVANDTVAVLFAAEAKIGGIVGTGYNLAMETPQGVINSESGGYALQPTHDFARQIDTDPITKTGNKGLQLAEKQIGGKYLGKVFQYAAEKLAKEGLISTVPEVLRRQYNKKGEELDVDAKSISDYLLNPSEQGDVPALREVAELLRHRSAQITGIMIATAMQTFPDVFTEEEIIIPIEGSIFWLMPGYMETVTAVIERRTGKKVTFSNIEDAGRKGAAVLVLNLAHRPTPNLLSNQ